MGDKWTTSGGWRLKAKQSRTFAARSTIATTRKNTRTSGGPNMIIPKANSHGSNPQLRPLARKRNGGVQGSYSAYADPLARRAIAASSLPPQDGDGYNPDHPLHQSRLQNNIRRRIRDPNQRNEIIAHYNPTYHSGSSGIREWGYGPSQSVPTAIPPSNYANIPPPYMHRPNPSLLSNTLPNQMLASQRFPEQTMYPLETHPSYGSEYGQGVGEMYRTNHPNSIPPFYSMEGQNRFNDRYSAQCEHYFTGIPKFQQHTYTPSNNTMKFQGQPNFTPKPKDSSILNGTPSRCQIVPFENFNSPTEQEIINMNGMNHGSEWFHDVSTSGKENIPPFFENFTQQPNLRLSLHHDGGGITPSVTGFIPKVYHERHGMEMSDTHHSQPYFNGPTNQESNMMTDPFDIFSEARNHLSLPAVHNNLYTRPFEIPYTHTIPIFQREIIGNFQQANGANENNTLLVPDVEYHKNEMNEFDNDSFDVPYKTIPILQDRSKENDSLFENVKSDKNVVDEFIDVSFEIPNGLIPVQENSLPPSNPNSSLLPDIKHSKNYANEFENEFFDIRDEVIPNFRKKENVEPSQNINTSNIDVSLLPPKKKDNMEAEDFQNYSKSSVQECPNMREMSKAHQDATIYCDDKSMKEKDEQGLIDENCGSSHMSSTTDDSIAYPIVRNPKPCTKLPYKIRFFNEGVEVDINNRPISQATSNDSDPNDAAPRRPNNTNGDDE